MAIITKPSIIKGSIAIITLNKSELAAHPLVSTNSYFSNTSRWKKVEVIYISNPGNQSKIVEFDASLTSPTGSILFSLKALDLFQVEKLNIVDFDEGLLQIPRESLIVQDFDIDMGSGAGTLLLSRDFSSPASISASESIPNVFGGSYEFINGNLKFTITDPNATQNGGYIDYLYIGAIPGFIPTTAHKLRIHIAAHSGGVHLVTAIGQEWTTPKRTTAAQLSAAVGSYIDIEGIGSGDNIYKFTLEPICKDDNNQNTLPGSLSISKIELIKL